ncbi:MAG: hypothetical protein IJS30_04410 [Bacteroidales bacterium]|nr:hypothetical protein [Bacteroidales bacterium]
MKKIYLLSLVALLAVCGCQKVEKSDAASAVKVFTAEIEESAVGDANEVAVKTSMDVDGNVLWKKGDQVSVFAGSTINEPYQVSDASDGKTAASLQRVESPGFVAGGEIPDNVAFYPYVASAQIARGNGGYVISDIALPSTQTYAAASFGGGSFPMAAVSSSTSDLNFKFRNVLGGLKLQLKGTTSIASISVAGNNNEILCGSARVTVSASAVPSVTLSDAAAGNVTLDCGDGVQLDASTATAFIIALPPIKMAGGFTVTVTDTEGNQLEIKTIKSQRITRSKLLAMPVVTFEIPDQTPAEAVAIDLGLPSGLKWASCNVGASTAGEFGDYFAWGETEPYYSSQDPLTWKEAKNAGYTWASYQWCEGSYDTQTKYCTDSYYGPVDNKTVLCPEDDAANVNWGGSWRMPTDAEWTELMTECAWIWITRNGVSGRLVTGANGNSIFLPAAGIRYESYLDDLGYSGYYWSSSLCSDSPNCAWYMYFDEYDVDAQYNNRFVGLSVRPVME